MGSVVRASTIRSFQSDSNINRNRKRYTSGSTDETDSSEDFGIDSDNCEFQIGKSVFESKSLSYRDSTDYFAHVKKPRKSRKIGKIYKQKFTYSNDFKVSEKNFFFVNFGIFL